MTTRTEVSDATETVDMPISYDHRQAIMSGDLNFQLRSERHLRDKLGMDGKGSSIVIELTPEDEEYGVIHLYRVTWEKSVTVSDLGGLDRAKELLMCEEEAPRYSHVLQFLCQYRSLVYCSVEAEGFRERTRENSSPVNDTSDTVNEDGELDLLF